MQDMNEINRKRETFSKYREGIDKAIAHLAHEHNWTKETVQRVFGEQWESWVSEIIWFYYVEEGFLNSPIHDVMSWYEQETAPPPSRPDSRVNRDELRRARKPRKPRKS